MSCPMHSPTSPALRKELPPLPERMLDLPVSRGYPVPFFVAYQNGQPDFRVTDSNKLLSALVGRLCWVCGKRLTVPSAFLLGPMGAINRVSAEPASHLECAEWAVRGCPFIARPHMVRREAGLPPSVGLNEHMEEANPGVMLAWINADSAVETQHRGVLIHVRTPGRVVAYRGGREATRAELREAMTEGATKLYDLARGDASAAALLKKYIHRAQRTVGEHFPHPME